MRLFLMSSIRHTAWIILLVNISPARSLRRLTDSLLVVTRGTVTFNGKDLLAMSPEDRAHEGVFLSFQTPVEIPGVSMVNFMRAAVNEQRKYRHLPALSASEFLKLMREKRAIVELDNKLANRSVNEGFSGGEKKRNEIFQMAMLEPTSITYMNTRIIITRQMKGVRIRGGKLYYGWTLPKCFSRTTTHSCSENNKNLISFKAY